MKLFKLKYTFEVYYFLVSILYFLVVKEMWAFRKINYNLHLNFEFLFFKYFIVSLFVLFTINIYKKKKMSLFSKNVISVFLFLDFIPSSILYSSIQDSDWRIYFSHILLFYSLLYISTISIKINLPVLNQKQSMLLLIIILFVGVLPYLRYLPYIDLKNLILKDVYTTRLRFRGLFDSYSGYTHSWFTRVIIPVIFVYVLKFKIRFIAIVNFIILLFLYLMGAVKSVLIGSILVVIFYFVKEGKLQNLITKSLIVLTIIALVTSIFIREDLNTIAVLLHRRIMFVPQILDYCYYDFFNNNHLYWSNSFLKGFLSYPYESSTPRLIGLEYFNKDEMAANNGLISDGFSQAGFLGVLINIFILNIYLSIINSCKIDMKFFGVFFFMILGFLSSSMSTVLITHGGILLIILSVLLLRNKTN